MELENIKIIGTSHIADQSIREVKQAITNFKPGLVALELDQARYQALTTKRKRRLSLYSVRRVGLKGSLFALIASWASRQLGRVVKVSPGTEMVTAIRLAKKSHLPIALIDQDVRITLSKLSRSISWKERIHFLVDLFRGIFFRKSVQKELGIKKLDLSKVPPDRLIRVLLKQVKRRYPNIYRILVEERNRIMADRLTRLRMQNPDQRILVVVGAGHVKGLAKLLKEEPISYSFTAG